MAAAIMRGIEFRIIPSHEPARRRVAIDPWPYLLTPSQQIARIISKMLPHGDFLRLFRGNRQDFTQPVDQDTGSAAHYS